MATPWTFHHVLQNIPEQCAQWGRVHYPTVVIKGSTSSRTMFKTARVSLHSHQWPNSGFPSSRLSWASHSLCWSVPQCITSRGKWCIYTWLPRRKSLGCLCTLMTLGGHRPWSLLGPLENFHHYWTTNHNLTILMFTVLPFLDLYNQSPGLMGILAYLSLT